LPLKKLDVKWPFGLDLIWTAFEHARAHRILRFFVQIIEQNGITFEQDLLGQTGIDTVDPKNIETILSTQFTNFSLGDRPKVFAPLLGSGIFTQDGESWKHSRDLLRPLFLSNRVDNFVQIQEHVERLIDCIPSNEAVDLQALFFRFTLDTTTYLLFGRSINSLRDHNPQTEAFADSFMLAQDYLARRGRLGGFYWLIGGAEFRSACATVHKFIDDHIADALAEIPSSSTPATATADEPENEKWSKYGFLGTLLRETRNPTILRDQLLNVLLAGRDTTACCLTWTFRLLTLHPSVLSLLRAEVASVIPSERELSLGYPPSPPSRNDLKRMPYLGYVIKEVLRLYPSVPINSRAATSTTTLPRGGGPHGSAPVLVRSGEAVGWCVYAMHRRREIYGPDSEDFRPERWDPGNWKTDTDTTCGTSSGDGDENGNGKEGGGQGVSLKNVGWGYLPFNGGPRVCLGQEFALLEVGYTVVRLLQVFSRIEYDETRERVRIGEERQDVTLVLACGDGCWVRLRR
jgi:cytochrome P450